MPTSPKILALGGAHIDRRGQVSGTYVPAASNPGMMREDVGGVVFNALRSVVKRGVSASLISVRGGDAAADTVATAIDNAGIVDLSVVFLDRVTPSYTAMIDADGELIVGLADMALYDLAFPKQIRRAKVREAIAAADAILCDANLPTVALERLVALAGGRPVFAIAVSPAKVVRLAPLLADLSLLFMNRREAAALVGAEPSGQTLVRQLRQAGLNAGVVTAGSAPVLGFDDTGAFEIDPPTPRRIADVTGAGDALTGATVAAMLRGLPLRVALREGLAAAMLAIESAEAVPSFTTANFTQALALVREAQEVA
ncbi:carbohydrate kinase [Mesorhizobium sp. M2D.F.Ca.ET.185.01.1.1]|uniref:carbohydrate kinase family protein n=1 Tax=unclassified Mesorhizobium TaxID=325217 RepID=UPI000FCB4A4D|nr:MULTISPECIES: carbohydrate kinase family protein [unclassified Mesorhizobium]TGP52970.1 carbohydrate kinase [bacterium M00.F.Ca.ET.230.01.1.1]TGP80753.1 carbohydrate kinase [bacterium M00.F.Ca.ET.227.01.1.1]TGP90537.1 carbohydrate kinase [bacterium M00.F.Ca.ET.221.01.1.1]TGP97216.1 carbohydrate kinase [bacterium M00.F.Ca.ET.222.01.1.1]TGT75749.1 carbohydrate kinase [bacterium M00.F.Ca.ET.159.01.1.1]TGT84812.1 carbohydrate kinase [bacterium M00.F.Ca.ET.157.01.1.1]TGU02027.1 carbohydrate ki